MQTTKTVLTVILLMVCASSLTANYFLYNQANSKTLKVDPIDFAAIK